MAEMPEVGATIKTLEQCSYIHKEEWVCITVFLHHLLKIVELYEYRKIIVFMDFLICIFKAFEMDVYRGDDPLSESELLGQLNAIVEMSSSSEDYPAVGAFTASDRRLWGKIYRKLKRGTKCGFVLFLWVCCRTFLPVSAFNSFEVYLVQFGLYLCGFYTGRFLWGFSL